VDVSAEPARLVWRPEALPAAVRETVLAPGAPLEVVEEDVLGVPCLVFAQRPPHLRAVFENGGRVHADTPYLIFPDRTFTYADAVASAARMAAVLARDFGVEKGDRVAVASANGPEYAMVWWATVSLGAIATGLNGWWTARELEYGIELARPKVLFVDRPRLDRLAAADLPDDLRVVLLDELTPHLDGDGTPMPDVAIDEDDPMVILFTSGTTGRPKGALLSHRTFVHCAMSSALLGASAATPASPPSEPGTRPATILAAPFFHVSGSLPLSTGPAFGSTMVFPPLGAWNETTHLRMTEEHRITGWGGVPTQYWRMLQHPELESFDLSSLRSLGGGGAVFPPELHRLVAEKLPNVRVTQGFGMSETLGSGTRLFGSYVTDHPASVGVIEPMCEVEVRDPDGVPLPEHEIGEICIRGACVFLGYWDNPEASAAVLDDRRWYRTGDFGRIEGELLYLESRMRDLIIRGGENIYPIEVENRLVEHPDIADACVIGVDHQVLGQEVLAVVVLREGADLSADEVRRWAAGALASFKVPAEVVFRGELPYTQTGKVLKHEVEAEIVAERARSR
jgi:acyl-CoA synthetase (AMP-forming)/AMP-acid ligase II